VGIVLIFLARAVVLVKNFTSSYFDNTILAVEYRTAAELKKYRREKAATQIPPSCNKTACPTERNYSTGGGFIPAVL
jgi:hypothetical protein